ncbi:MAG: LytTR family transcriptional regulator DNA-binding domain-containing protein [Eubacterium sp.]|nr:LytTR family transcriptional regulator DNA-binding domain-containing protein [Eubacterium sp.]
MKLIRKQIDPTEEEAVILEYIEWTSEWENLSDYIEGKKRQIIGYGTKKEMYSIQLDDILYFEAVGDLVFAYTGDQVYEIKMRLYQVEDIVQQNGILRASKSFLVNVRKIEKVRSVLNGRFMAVMENGEEVLITRHYAREVMDAIKSA